MDVLYDKTHVTKDKMEYRVQFLQFNTYFQGKLLINGSTHYESAKALSKANVIRWLNKCIDELNHMRALSPKIPQVKYSIEAKPLKAKKEKAEAEPKAEKSEPKPEPQKEEQKMITVSLPVIDNKPVSNDDEQQKEAVQVVNIKTQRKKVIPRKPFTPYGLNGYFVDKQGNVRLMLDRRANAKTITLTPDMFSSLADMVRKTQTQQTQQEQARG